MKLIKSRNNPAMKRQISCTWLFGIASLGLSTVTLVAYQPHAWAAPLGGSCSIPPSSTDRPYLPLEVEQSFLNADCTPIFLTKTTTFFRYYSFPPANPPRPDPLKPPGINIGRFITSDLFTLNSDAIVKLALFPFNPPFQNFGYYREEVTVAAGTTLYEGIAGPQPYNQPNSCYTGGAKQYFFADSNVSTNLSITFANPTTLTLDYQNLNTYGVGDPCQKIPEPSPLAGIGAIAALGLAASFNRILAQSRLKQTLNR
jgi:hypothetical protein